MDAFTLSVLMQYLTTFDNLKTYGVTVTLSGVIIVFSMLVLLVVVIGVFGALMSKTSSSNKTPVTKAEVVEHSPVPAVNALSSSEDEDVIAAISAAVMMMYEGTGKTPVIRSIRPAQRGVRSAWSMAGVMNNTRPF